MELNFANRMATFETGIFSVLGDKKRELIAQGRKVYDISVGTPDFKVSEHIMKAVSDAALNPENYKYSLRDIPELTEAIKNFYKTRFGVTIEDDEVTAVYGSQEGITHIGFTMCDPGDIVLVPDPGYPIFEVGPFLAGADLRRYPIYEEKNYILDFNDIDEETAKAAKAIIVSYPLNPVCATADDAFYNNLIAFAKKYNIIVIHDNAYSDIIYDREQGSSFLSYEGAKEVGIEFYSLSKSYNYTGARVSFASGNKAIIAKFKQLRSQIDYGHFLPVQYGAVAALTGPQDSVKACREEYARRNEALCGGFRSIGWDVKNSKGTMFAWGKIPPKYKDSFSFCLDLMEKTGVIVTPGSAFGERGEGYVRFALVKTVEEIQEIIKVIKDSNILA